MSKLFFTIFDLLVGFILGLSSFRSACCLVNDYFFLFILVERTGTECDLLVGVLRTLFSLYVKQFPNTIYQNLFCAV